MSVERSRELAVDRQARAIAASKEHWPAAGEQRGSRIAMRVVELLAERESLEQRVSELRAERETLQQRVAELESAGAGLFAACDHVCGTGWRDTTLVDGEFADEVNSAWVRLAKALGQMWRDEDRGT